MSPGTTEPRGTGSHTVAQEPGTQETAAPAGTSDAAGESGSPAPISGRRGLRGWLRALLRSLVTLVVTLVVLFVLGVAADAALHQVERTTTSTASYTGVAEIDLTVEGDGAITVHGSQSIGSGARVDFSDRATVFDPPQRTMTQVGDVLTITERCPDSRCSADLDLTIAPDTVLRIREGGADRIAHAGVTLTGLDGPVTLYAVPASVKVVNSSVLVSGLVVGSMSCDYPAICLVQTVS